MHTYTHMHIHVYTHKHTHIPTHTHTHTHTYTHTHTQCICMCAKTYSCVCHELIMYVLWLIYIFAMTLFHTCHDHLHFCHAHDRVPRTHTHSASICAPRLIFWSYVCYDPFEMLPCLARMPWPYTHTHTHAHTHTQNTVHLYVRQDLFVCMTWLDHVCAMTHLKCCHESLRCMSWPFTFLPHT